jgi:hypothetical protein
MNTKATRIATVGLTAYSQLRYEMDVNSRYFRVALTRSVVACLSLCLSNLHAKSVVDCDVRTQSLPSNTPYYLLAVRFLES